MRRLYTGLIDVYPYRKVGPELEFLLLHRAEDKIYAGQWRMVGGKIRQGETAWKAALRELQEETGLKPRKLWVVPTMNSFYEWETDYLHCIPVFAAELPVDARIHLNAEHRSYGWFRPEVAQRKVAWPEQRRILALISELLQRHQVLDSWVIPRNRWEEEGA